MEYKTTDAQRESVKRWTQGRDTMTLRFSKEDGEMIRSAARNEGLSLVRFFLVCVGEHLQNKP